MRPLYTEILLHSLVNDHRNGENLFFLILPAHNLHADWRTVMDFGVI
jgi:hypothetical protein